MVLKVWKSSRLLNKDNRGIIKLVPKADELFLLKNWRPITLLTTTYKIIAKIFAWRLKAMLPDIVDQQQTGFIAGRSIVENILSLRMAQEWVPVTGQEIMFVKLDFQKAYDRVSHSYLWDTLKALGMSQINIRRIQGLVTGGAAQVHVNGCFTKRFEVTRGVRQGCPLAPLLFAMVTQPLMRLFREEERRGRILGVTYGGQRTLMHQIYADDTGVNLTMQENQFTRLKEIIQTFEGISGAKLNLSKSLIMPICPSIPPAWVQATGCEIAGPGKDFLYLGIATSNPVDEVTIAKAINRKIMEKLSHWANRLLSWPARIILLKQVLAATPLYQLLSVGLEKKGLEGLETLCRQFLWGWADQDTPKASLVAWERISQTKQDGGLGWTSLLDKAQALQVKNLVKVMRGRALNGLCWQKVMKKIAWEDTCRDIPEHLTLEQGIQIANREDMARTMEMQRITGLLRKIGIYTLKDGAEAIASNGSWKELLYRAGIFPEEHTLRNVELLEDWIGRKTLLRKELHEVAGWVWKSDRAPVNWDLSTKEWTDKIKKQKDFTEYLNGKWGINSTKRQWEIRWTRLWRAEIHHRRKS
ncbi:hypothetical protein R1sor_022372 [Riccia sorocarpa]|uniref:Reverse transcriptase domain-containing protein n=1 Tax=Riccia sorocarpa TaxID=122646 RepID=A0ABD3GL63_9MARC